MQAMLLGPLIRRLNFYAEMRQAETDALLALAGRRRSFLRGESLVEAGQTMTHLLVMHSGWAARYKLLEDGRRQILNFLLPGDIFDLQVLVAAEADHGVVAITDGAVTAIAPRDLRALMDASPRVLMGFWWTQVQEEAFLREQIVRNGRQTARERIAHLLLELLRRAQIVREAEEDRLRLPLTQVQIADALGLTPIHTNRVLRAFHREGLIAREGQELVFRDIDALAALCDFDAGYFHLDAYARRLRNAD